MVGFFNHTWKPVEWFWATTKKSWSNGDRSKEGETCVDGQSIYQFAVSDMEKQS